MKIVVITSGGMDSAVLLHNLAREGHELKALGVNYGQRHRKELSFAAAQAANLGIPYQTADLRSLWELLPGSSQTDPDVPVPEGHYEEESMKLTVVPNRNMIMLSVAVGHAIALKYDAVAYGAHYGDHAVYPDCRDTFASAMDAAVRFCDWHKMELLRPFVGISKAEIAKLGSDLNVPFHRTWSCYKGGEKHCGRCGTCVERREAFHLAGVADPTQYADDAPSLEDMVRNGWKL
ncbi:MAG: putative 7-cyano-7-deazaguanine synthase [Prokaryotic dsDNA virus sp.]|nr:MAG: putative 7-cyano-7-deazaguanine synthase [Prokaryotic dsDNA virus sp.]|tara:strand:- start:197 stop:898 length:702 start_codon:yes stop_codon:yes gene_type:complete